jgi:hypothetical protein
MNSESAAVRWLAAQPGNFLAKLRSSVDAAKLSDYADAHVSDLSPHLSDWTKKDLLAAIGYDPLKGGGSELKSAQASISAPLESGHQPKNYQIEPAQETVTAFKELLASKGLAYFVSWRWEGWRKFGIIGVRPAGQSQALAPAVDREEFARSTSRFTAADRVIGKVRTGSPKHLAISALSRRLASQSRPPVACGDDLEGKP